jgi:hypothetical protein
MGGCENYKLCGWHVLQFLSVLLSFIALQNGVFGPLGRLMLAG